MGFGVGVNSSPGAFLMISRARGTVSMLTVLGILHVGTRNMGDRLEINTDYMIYYDLVIVLFW